MRLDYLSCQNEEKPYPAFWNFDISLCEFLAFNLKQLANSNSCGTVDGWSDGAFRSFLLHHARRFDEYAKHSLNWEYTFEEADILTKRAQKSLRDIALFLPRLWD